MLGVCYIGKRPTPVSAGCCLGEMRCLDINRGEIDQKHPKTNGEKPATLAETHENGSVLLSKY